MPTGATGLNITKCRAFLLLLIYIGSTTTIGLLVYFFTGRLHPTAISCSTPHKRPSSYQANSAVAVVLSKSVQDVRLPRNVLPHHYYVRLLPILQKGNFTVFGRVAIDVECKQETDRIVLHSAAIVVDLKSVQVVTNTFLSLWMA